MSKRRSCYLAVAALLVESAVLDGEAIVLRVDNTSNFEALRSRQGQTEAILVWSPMTCSGRTRAWLQVKNTDFERQ